LGTLPVGERERLSITVDVGSDTSGATIVNEAQVRTSNNFDPDSMPNNSLPYEDDHAAAVLVVNPLMVEAIDPMGNDSIVTTSQAITVTFDRAFRMSAVNSTTFVVRGAQTGIYTGQYSLVAANQVWFDAASSFKPGEIVVASLNNGILAGDGAPLAPFTWQFRATTTGGTGDFAPHPWTPEFGADYSWAVSLADLDGDSDLDAFVANAEVVTGADFVNTIWLNDGEGNFQEHPTTPSFGDGSSLDAALGDLDGDGDQDAVVAQGDGDPQTVWMNDGSGRFTAHPTTPSFGAGYSQAVVLGDLDGDGSLDAVITHEDRGMTVWLNDGSGNFRPHPFTPTFGGTKSWDVALGDLDGDGDLDAVVVNRWGQPQTVWLNDGTGSFSPHPTTPALGADYSLAVSLGDLDGDGDLDAVISNANNQQNYTIWLNDGLGNLGPHPSIPVIVTGDSGLDVVLGDLDADGDLDLVGIGHNDEVVYLNNGAGVFYLIDTLPIWGGMAAALGDLDNDGDLDVVVARLGNKPQQVWLNQD
jgi:hypothetical protein